MDTARTDPLAAAALGFAEAAACTGSRAADAQEDTTGTLGWGFGGGGGGGGGNGW